MSIRSSFLVLACFALSSCFGMGNRSPAPVVVYGSQSGAGSAGVHNVSRGDTLYSISNRYRLPIQDIAVMNKLKPPFKLSEGQRLRLPPPQEYKVKQGDTLYEISRLFGVSASEIARINRLQSPYILRVGQVLRLPSFGRTVKSTSSVTRSVSSSNVRPSVKPNTSEVTTKSVVNNDGVPIPQGKPNVTKVSQVKTQVPKRSSSKFLNPVNGRLISNYGAKKSGLHNDGINIAAPRGTAVKSAENGVVVYAGDALKGSGNLVLVRHDNQYMSAYAHLDKVRVTKGQVVKRGASIGTVGSTGSVSEPQLHFEIRRGTSAINPSKYIGK